jgi:hypothetical protein
MPEPSILDERLAEIDRRLRSIQSDLTPVDIEPPLDIEPPPPPLDREPPPPVPLRPAPTLVDATPLPVPSLAPEITELTARLVALTDAHERLLELHRELLSQYADMLERRAAETTTLAVTAGPFSTTAAVRAFEDALAALPGVSGVAVREFTGDDRVQVDVRLHAR